MDHWGVEEAIEWLRRQVQARLATAQEAISNGDGAWHTGCTCDHGCRDYPACEQVEGDDITIYNEGGHDSGQARHIAANDPQDTIARCEAELGILDVYDLWAAEPGGHPTMNAAACAVSDAVRHLASGYKHRDGYTQHWERV